MYEVEVLSQSCTYEVHIEAAQKLEIAPNVIAILDSRVDLPLSLTPKQRSELSKSTVFVLANEELKTLRGVESLLIELSTLQLARGQEIIAIGGGSVQDAVSLAASLYMRGIPWTYVPTTLMSMLDSCIGGKSSINVGEMKNLAGNFYPPRAILIDPLYVETLDETAVFAGLAEGAKICFAYSPEAFEEFLKLVEDWRRSRDVQFLEALISHTLTCKKYFIEIDEFDKAERRLLNFGHTYGHSLEAGTGFQLSHGIAIAIGMLAAIHQSGQVEAMVALSKFLNDGLLQIEDAWSHLEIDWKVVGESLLRDKKNSATTQRLVLPNSNEALGIVEFRLDAQSINTSLVAIQAALDSLATRSKD
jgi:3-dehydroquinate synthase